MRYVELRRHTMRLKPGKHLTQAGVSLARRVGEGMGPYTRVITSDLPRAFETAIAMGFAVDQQRGALSTYGDAIEAEIADCETIADLSRVAARPTQTRETCRLLARSLKEITEGLQEGESALVISHGGLIEMECIGCMPHAEYDIWGGFFGYCEGARLAYEAGAFVNIELLRIV